MAMTDREQFDICRQLLRRRSMLIPDPHDLPPFGALVQYATGQTAEIIAWFGLDPNETSGFADKRIAFVYMIDGHIPGKTEAKLSSQPVRGLLPEDEVTLIRRQEEPLFVRRHLAEQIQ